MFANQTLPPRLPAGHRLRFAPVLLLFAFGLAAVPAAQPEPGPGPGPATEPGATTGPAEGTESGAAPAAPAVTEESVKDFPKAYWYAGDAWMKALRDSGNFGNPLAEAKLWEIKNFKLAESDRKTKVRFSMIPRNGEGKELRFVFTRSGEKWTATEGWSGRGLSRDNLYSTDFFIKKSLRSFVQAEFRKLVARQGIYSPDKKPHAMAPPAGYSTLTGEGLSGSGFHFSWKGKNFAAATLHQFGHKTPESFISLNEETPVRVLSRVHDQRDLQVVTYQSGGLDRIRPLEYSHGEPEPEVGDPVFLLRGDEWVKAHILTSDPYLQTIQLEMEKPFRAMGASGSPVISGTTGKLMAILTDADSPEAATVAGCEVLRMPESALHEVQPDVIPASIFGVPAIQPSSSGTAKSVQSALIHPGLFLVTPGMTREELLRIRPDSSRELQATTEGLSTLETVPKTWLFPFAAYRFGKGTDKVSGLGLTSFRSATAGEITSLAQFFPCYFGPPDVMLERDTNPARPGAEEIMVCWSRDSFSAGMGFSCRTPAEFSAWLSFRTGKQPVEDMIEMKNAQPVSPAPDSLHAFVQAWTETMALAKPAAN